MQLLLAISSIPAYIASLSVSAKNQQITIFPFSKCKPNWTCSLGQSGRALSLPATSSSGKRAHFAQKSVCLLGLGWCSEREMTGAHFCVQPLYHHPRLWMLFTIQIKNNCLFKFAQECYTLNVCTYWVQCICKKKHYTSQCCHKPHACALLGCQWWTEMIMTRAGSYLIVSLHVCISPISCYDFKINIQTIILYLFLNAVKLQIKITRCIIYWSIKMETRIFFNIFVYLTM